MSLQGKTAVVTGVTSGIGRALVDLLVEREVRVIGIGRDEDKLARVAAETGLVPLLADLSESSQIDRCVEQICSLTESLDILVNNAAECVYAQPLELSSDRWRRLVDVNLNAVVQLCSQLVDRLKAQSDVVNISSVTADFVPSARFAPYAVTKAALHAFTRSLRLQLAPQGTRVTLISPGLVDTEIYEKVDGFESTLAKLKDTVPDWLLPEDVARAIVWALEQPEHVVVGELVLFPRGQTR